MRKTTIKAAAAALVGVALCAGTVGAVATSSAYAADTTEDGYEIVIGTPKSISYIGDYEGYTTVDEWESAVAKSQGDARKAYEDVLAKMNGRDDVDWTSLRAESNGIDDDIEAIWTIASADECSAKIKEFEGKVDAKITERDEEIAAEEEAARIAEEEAAAAAAAAYYDYGGYSGGGGYHPTGGLTPQSGVNYYGDQRETYYSSSVLWHYATDSWTLDDEGFYREGDYYVVAANDGQYSNGDTFECSKGTAIVRDSGCDYGTTDYYVAW